ncbi:nuclear transport factor 2 family protein [Kitasatospora viridis]|uniref:SnoaL-like protein n=1 Tax=Kitasatospora viridis TaxID=281105 RepID=A0A561UDC6_9ACTN|nr:nuclear transport factor 2 family protein [Kitasatospora viridis]TWF97361.1 SnoaL-like protein [Kitasatospora viridis]
MDNQDGRTWATELFDLWTALWNGDLALSEQIMAPEFTLRYAQPGTEVFDTIRTPQQFADLIAAFRKARPGLRFAPEGPTAVDLQPGDGGWTGLVTSPYLASFDGGERESRSGTDMLRVADGKIVEVWSVSNERTYYH